MKMKKIILGILILSSYISSAQKLNNSINQGSASQAINQLSLISQDASIKTYSSPPTRYSIASNGDTIRVSMYIDSATKAVRMLNSSLGYTDVALSTTAGIKVVVQTYAIMRSLAVGLNPYDFIVVNDENKQQNYTNYQYYPNNGTPVIMWVAALKEN